VNFPTLNLAERDALEARFKKQAPRRFTAEPQTGFDLPNWAQVLTDIREADEDEARAIERKREILAEEYADQLADERRERIEAGL